MDQSEIVVSFELGVEEARRQAVDLQKAAGVTKASIRVLSGVGMLSLMLGIVEVATDRIKASGWSSLFFGCAYVLMALQGRSRIINVPAGVETRLRFGVAAIVVERPAPQTLPWSAVEGVDRYDGAMVVRFFASEITPPLEQRLVIPAEAFPDGLAALWQLSEQMLLGPLRPVSAQLSVDETGALRRRDAMHIENLRARRAATKRTRLPAQSVLGA